MIIIKPQPPRPICRIAQDIKREWRHISPHARPYLEAMLRLSDISDRYICESASDIISRFLCNASSFRGEGARTLKQELKNLIK